LTAPAPEKPETQKAAPRPVTPARVIAAVAVLAGLALLAIPGLLPVDTPVGRTFGAVLIALGLWSTAVTPAYFTAVLFMFLAVVIGLAPAKVVFSGFLSTAVWLVFGGLVIGVAVRKSGLGERAVRTMLRSFPVSYGGMLWALVLTGVVLSFLIPSATGRVVLLMPIVRALCDGLGFGPDRPGRTGLVLATGLGTTLPAFAILPSNVPNMALMGSAESVLGLRFSYGDYLLLNFPVMGLLTALILPVLIGRLFPDTPSTRTADTDATPWSVAERKLIIILLLSLGLWMTDFAHGISPAWVGLGAAIVIMLPVAGLLPTSTMAKDIDYGPWIFVAGIIGLGAVVTHTGAGSILAQQIFAVLPLEKGNGPGTFAALFALGFLVPILTTLPAAPGILTPLAEGIAQASGWPVESILMTQVPGWVFFALPYMAPPMVLTLALGGVSVTKALKVMLPFSIGGIVILLPLQYLWGNLLGVYP